MRRKILLGAAVLLGALLLALLTRHPTSAPHPVSAVQPASKTVDRDQVAAGRALVAALAASKVAPRPISATDAGPKDPGATLEVDVVDSRGEPIPKAQIGLRRIEADSAQLDASDAGHMTFRGLAPGSYDVLARAEGYQDGQGLVAILRGRDETLSLDLAEAASVSGMVVDEAGAPVAGVRVSIETADEVITDSGEDTGSDGRFDFDDLPPGEAWLTTEDRGHVPARQRVEAPAQGVLLHVMTGGAVRLRVLHSDGSPAAAAVVYAKAVPPDELGARPAHAIASGQYEIRGLLPGRYEAWVEDPECGEDRGPVALRAPFSVSGRKPEDVSVRLPPAPCFQGTVVDPSGRPIPDVGISAGWSGGDVDDVAQAQTDERGHFSLAARAGPVDLRLMADGYEMKDVHVPSAPASVLDPIVLQPLARLSGRVLDEAGHPVPRFWLNARWTKSPDGRFDIPRDPQASALLVRAPGKVWSRRALDGGVAAVGDVIVESGRTVRGQVVEAGTRDPIEGAALWAVDADNQRLSDVAHTAPDGHFELEHVPAGDTLILVEIGVYRPVIAPVAANVQEIPPIEFTYPDPPEGEQDDQR